MNSPMPHESQGQRHKSSRTARVAHTRSWWCKHRREGCMSTPRRILVKQVNWLGDLVMSQPALRALRHAYPDSHLALLIKSELASFFDGASWIDEVIPYTVRKGALGLADRARLVAELRRRR